MLRIKKKKQKNRQGGGAILINHKPSPHVLDLKKIFHKHSAENAVLTVDENSFDGWPRFSELTIFSFFGGVYKFLKKFLFFFFGGFKKIRWFLWSKILGAGKIFAPLESPASRGGRNAMFDSPSPQKAVVEYKSQSFLTGFAAKTAAAGDFLLRLFRFFKFSLADYKIILRFGAMAFVFILPLQMFSYYEGLKKAEQKVLGAANEAYGQFLAGGNKILNFDFSGAAENFDRAAGTFDRAKDEVGKINFVIASILETIPGKGEQFEAGEALLFAGEKISLVGKIFSEVLDSFLAEGSAKTLTQKIKIFRNRLTMALPEIEMAADRLQKVKSQSIPDDKREVFEKLKETLPILAKDLKDLLPVSDFLTEFLGDKATKRYLFVFQNSGEIRPTGGFMGTVALADFDRGELLDLEIPGGGTYDFQGSLVEKIMAPEPLRLINARWELQDANWFPDFPSSAQKIKWFYEKAGGPTVDGVVAINVGAVAKLLGAVGPIEMPEHGKLINQENFIAEIQKTVEIEYDKKINKPKQILTDLAPKLIEKILKGEPENFGKILNVLAKSLYEKDILLYSSFPETEHQILNADWGGQIKGEGEKSDYLMVVHANIGGRKTDSVIKEEINLLTKITDDGYIKNKVIIKKKHQGEKGDFFTGVRNIDYLRVYVPSGSVLLGAWGFEAPPKNLFEKPDEQWKLDANLKNIEGRALVDEPTGTKITNEFGKTVFGNWVQVDPGEEATVGFEYLLPFKLTFPEPEKNWFKKFFDEDENNINFYRLLVQKQPGTGAEFASDVNFPESWKPVWQYGENMKVRTTVAEAAGALATDKFYLIGFEK